MKHPIRQKGDRYDGIDLIIRNGPGYGAQLIARWRKADGTIREPVLEPGWHVAHRGGGLGTYPEAHDPGPVVP